MLDAWIVMESILLLISSKILMELGENVGENVLSNRDRFLSWFRSMNYFCS